MPPKKPTTNQITQLNAIDHGFNHLAFTNREYIKPLANPTFPKTPSKEILNTNDRERQYIGLLEAKLILARNFIYEEIKVSFDPTRNMLKNPIAVLLAKPPILISNYAQELIRELIKLRAEAYAIANEEEAQEVGHQFLWNWNELKCVIALLMTGEDEAQKMSRAEATMERVLGENIVDES